ncbi:MAG: hypothetical protein V7749_14325 [Cocleimonas sp.]
MSKKLKFAFLSLSIFLLSACGGGSSNGPIDEEPLTPYTVFGSDRDEAQGRTISTAAGADGDIMVVIDELNEPDFALVDGLASMVIVNVQRSETFSFSCPDGTNAKISFFENFATGVEEIIATANGQRLDCRSTYQTDLVPTIVGSSSSISDLLVLSDVSDVNVLISTTCPNVSSVNNPLNEDLEPDAALCDVSLVVDTTVTDDEGFTHLISYESISTPD